MKSLTYRLRRNIPLSCILVCAALIFVVAIFGRALAPYDPYESVLQEALQPPSAQHWFGTDALGRDLFSRVIAGTSVSVFSTLGLVAIIFFVGSLLGILAGFFGGIVDTVIMRIADTMIAFPDLVLAMAIVGILGPNLSNAIIAIAMVSWTRYARLSRSLVLKIKHNDYIDAARLNGSTHRHILMRYMVPNALPTMVITAATDIGATMLSLAALSFLGFGVQPPAPEWGYMLSEARQYFLSAPWLLYLPGLAIFIVVVVFNLLGDKLRDLLDPRGEKNIDDLGQELIITPTTGKDR